MRERVSSIRKETSPLLHAFRQRSHHAAEHPERHAGASERTRADRPPQRQAAGTQRQHGAVRGGRFPVRVAAENRGGEGAHGAGEPQESDV